MTLDRTLDICQRPFYTQGAAVMNGRLYVVCSNYATYANQLQVQDLASSTPLLSQSFNLSDYQMITMLQVDPSLNSLYFSTYNERSVGDRSIWSLDPANGSVRKIIQVVRPYFSVAPDGSLVALNTCREILVFSPSGQLISKTEVQLRKDQCFMRVVKLTSGNFLATIMCQDETKDDIVEIAPSGQVGWGGYLLDFSLLRKRAFAGRAEPAKCWFKI